MRLPAPTVSDLPHLRWAHRAPPRSHKGAGVYQSALNGRQWLGGRLRTHDRTGGLVEVKMTVRRIIYGAGATQRLNTAARRACFSRIIYGHT